MTVIHFNSPEERMKYIKGEFEEIIPEVAEEKVEEKPKKAKKSAKKSKKEGKNDAVQAE